MTKKADTFVILYSDGRAENVKDGANYYDVLNHCSLLFQSAGSTSRLPQQLFRNGVCVVEKGLAHLGWDYNNAVNKATKEAIEKVRDKYKQPWEI